MLVYFLVQQKRIVNYTGCGISLGDPIDVTENGDWAKGVAEDDYKQVCVSMYSTF